MAPSFSRVSSGALLLALAYNVQPVKADFWEDVDNCELVLKDLPSDLTTDFCHDWTQGYEPEDEYVTVTGYPVTVTEYPDAKTCDDEGYKTTTKEGYPASTPYPSYETSKGYEPSKPTSEGSKTTEVPDESTKVPDEGTKVPDESTKVPDETTKAPDQPPPTDVPEGGYDVTVTSTTYTTYWTTVTVYPESYPTPAPYRRHARQLNTRQLGDRAAWCVDKPCRLVQYDDDTIFEACKKYLGWAPETKTVDVPGYTVTVTSYPTDCKKKDDGYKPDPVPAYPTEKDDGYEAEPYPTKEPEYDPYPTKEPEYDPYPTEEPEYDPYPTKEPEYDPYPTKEPEYDPYPTEEPEYDPYPTKEPEYDPYPTEEPEYDPYPTEEPEYDPYPTEEPEYDPYPTEEPEYDPYPTPYPEEDHDDGNYDDGNYDDGNYEDDSYDDGNYDDSSDIKQPWDDAFDNNYSGPDGPKPWDDAGQTSELADAIEAGGYDDATSKLGLDGAPWNAIPEDFPDNSGGDYERRSADYNTDDSYGEEDGVDCDEEEYPTEYPSDDYPVDDSYDDSYDSYAPEPEWTLPDGSDDQYEGDEFESDPYPEADGPPDYSSTGSWGEDGVDY